VQGRRYVSSTFAEHLVIDLGQNLDRLLHARLSDWEYQVLCMLASGKTVTAVAADLALSVKTISTHRSRILAKLHLRTTAELIHYAVRHYLVE
jgi:two-component system invasion response regulator UvrY